MSTYKELQQMDISQAVNQIVNDLFPKGSMGKVLTINLQMTATDYSPPEKRAFKEFYLVIARPSSYTFVGVHDSDSSLCTLPGAETDIEYVTYHDSCWRDGVSRTISGFADEMEKRFKEGDDIHVFNYFGLHGIKIIDGEIHMDGNKRTAVFVAPKINKKDE